MGGRGGAGRSHPSDRGETTRHDPHPDEPTPPTPPEPVAPPAADRPTPPAPDAPIEDWDRHIQQAYIRLAREIGSSWVPLAELRQELGDTPQHIQDQIFKALRRTNPDINFAPDSNRKTLRPDDHDAAHIVGGEPKHLLAINLHDSDGNRLQYWWQPGYHGTPPTTNPATSQSDPAHPQPRPEGSS